MLSTCIAKKEAGVELIRQRQKMLDIFWNQVRSSVLSHSMNNEILTPLFFY
jgi:hypothetical protein